MKLLSFLAILVLAAQPAFAQVFGPQVCTPGQTGFWGASTATEGYWTGLGKFLSGVGDYLQNLGDYEIKHEVARSAHMKNFMDSIRNRWAIKDEIAARRVTTLDKLERKLNNAERLAELQFREEMLIKKGILPKKIKPEYTFSWRGKKYKNYEAFKNSKEYTSSFAVEKRMRMFSTHIENKANEQQREQAVEFGKMWSEMSYFARLDYSKKSEESKSQTRAEWKNPQIQFLRIKLEDNKRFQEQRPDLFPRVR